MCPDTSKLSKYLKPEHAKDGDIITFLDAGVIVEKTFTKDGEEETKPILEITVKFRGGAKTYCPNGTSVKLLSTAWGPETETWIGKSAAMYVLPANNGKMMIVSKPSGKAPAASTQAATQAPDEEIPF